MIFLGFWGVVMIFWGFGVVVVVCGRVVGGIGLKKEFNADYLVFWVLFCRLPGFHKICTDYLVRFAGGARLPGFQKICTDYLVPKFAGGPGNLGHFCP